MQQTPAHERYNPDLLEVMPAGCARVLEVGCSSGALAAAYRARNPECTYVGVEIDPAFAELSRPRCDRVVTGDFETFDDEGLAGVLPADCIVFGDTLEHFRDPWAVLKRLGARMRPDDMICTCIPNSQHWSLQVRLATGRFHYEDTGLLDRTHLRFFTWTTIQHLFASTGFKITFARKRTYNEANREKFLPIVRSMAEAAGADAEQAVSLAMPRQFIVCAKRAG
jgi:SAM-dependent methyltransferase